MVDIRSESQSVGLAMALKTVLSSQTELPRYIVDLCSTDTLLLKELDTILSSWPTESEARPKLVGINAVPAGEVDRGTRPAANTLIIHGICDNGIDLWRLMEEVGISDPENGLYLYSPTALHAGKTAERRLAEASSAAEKLLFDVESFLPRVKKYGLAVLVKSRDLLDPPLEPAWMRDPTSLLTSLSAAGVLPEAGPAFSKGEVTDPDDVSVVHFKHRGFRVRAPDESDIPVLVKLERECWTEGNRASSAIIRRRITRNRAWHLVLENEDGVVAVVYSQRVESDEPPNVPIANISRLESAAGGVVLLLAINVMPAVQDRSYGDQLLEFMLQYCAAIPAVRCVIGVTRCKDYAKHNSMELTKYIDFRNEEGRLVDPILRFHELHGAKIGVLVPNYRPADLENEGFGVLVRYDLQSRRQRRELVIDEPKKEAETEQEIKTFITSAVAAVLNREGVEEDELDQPLFELGLDSADLLDLRERIGVRFGVRLDATFFAKYATCEQITKHLSECLLPRGEPAWKSPPIGEDREGAVYLTKPEFEGRGAFQAGPAGAVAITGVACRLPGDINDRFAYWGALVSGRELISQLPSGRWTWPTGIDTQEVHQGIDFGGFLSGIEEFDSEFFRIPPKEARLVDPQQRVLLQLAWACVEDAGYSPSRLLGTNTGVYIGASGSDYQIRLREGGVALDGHSGLATSAALLANRISYFFDWRGPSIQIDTACSGSLVALHEAASAIKSGACVQALAGGINIICHPASSVAFYSAGMLAKDGRCKTFDQAADGYVRSEGGVLFLLKNFEQAIADGDRIYGLIRGSAVNHGGQTAGLTVPSYDRQAELIRRAHVSAGVNAQSISYVEAHGTGTALGDPTEVKGLIEAFSLCGNELKAEPHCGLGSVKTNIGHLEAAAGAAGLLKILVSMLERKLPASRNFHKLNPHIDLVGSPFHVLHEMQEWRTPCDANGERLPRRAGVSSFGSGGTNAHLIVEEHIGSPQADRVELSELPPALIVLSARNEDRLREMVRQLLDEISIRPLRDEDLVDVAYTLQVGRDAMEARVGIVAASIAQLESKLRRYLAGEEYIEELYHGHAKRAREALAIFAGDEELQDAIAKWVARGKYGKLLELWVKGLSFDWLTLYATRRPRRVSLPTYPFAKDRHWFSEVAATEASTELVATNALHPLVHRNTSDLSGLRFSSHFDGSEFFLNEHRILGTRVLPGVAQLEMARAAVEQICRADEASSVRLSNVAWLRPIKVVAPVDVHIAFSQESDDGAVAYQIYTEEGGTEEPVVHSEGVAVPGLRVEPARLDLATLQCQCTSKLSAVQCYEGFRRIGIHYGPAHQAIEFISIGTDQALARLKMPASVNKTTSEYSLHPSLMDAAFQAALCLKDVGMFDEDAAPALALPFALDELEILVPRPSSSWALIRRSPGSVDHRMPKLDITLCDEFGNVGVQMRGFATRVLGTSLDGANLTDTVLFQPDWRMRVSEPDCSKDFEEHLVLLCGVGGRDFPAALDGMRFVQLRSTRADIGGRFIEYAQQALSEVQEILRARPHRQVLIQIVTPTAGEAWALMGLQGLIKTVELENPQVVGQLIAVDESESDDRQLAAKLLSDSRLCADRTIHYRDGQRLVMGWNEVRTRAENLEYEGSAIPAL